MSRRARDHWSPHRRGLVVRLAVAVVVVFGSVACGGAPSEASCGVDGSEFGPLTSQLGMSEGAATTFMEDNAIDAWIEVTADGDWSPLWARAEAELGTQIHRDLTWIDVGVVLMGTSGDDVMEVPVRVSRSYQGKVETARQGAFEPLGNGVSVSGCRIVWIQLADETHAVWLDFEV